MNNLNTVLMEGTLVRDPERSNQAEGSSTCKLALANNRYFIGKTGKWEQDASFFSIYVFGPVAEACLRILKKGRGIRIVGRLKQLRFTVAGLSREKVIILAEHIEFQPEKKADEKDIPVPEKEPGMIETKADSSLEMEDTSEQAERQEQETCKPEDSIPVEEVVETTEDGGDIDAPF